MRSFSPHVLIALIALSLSACTEGGDSPDANHENHHTADMSHEADHGEASDDMAHHAGDMTEADQGGEEECGETSSRIGWTATLSTKAHGVSGQAVIVDDCTVEIRNFNYDGTGLDVRVYGSESDDFRQGWPMTEDLRRSGGYSNETITATLPDARSMDTLDSVSIWCVDIPVDFGSGTFQAP